MCTRELLDLDVRKTPLIRVMDENNRVRPSGMSLGGHHHYIYVFVSAFLPSRPVSSWSCVLHGSGRVESCSYLSEALGSLRSSRGRETSQRRRIPWITY